MSGFLHKLRPCRGVCRKGMSLLLHNAASKAAGVQQWGTHRSPGKSPGAGRSRRLAVHLSVLSYHVSLS